MQRPQISLPRTDGYEAEDAKQMLRQLVRTARAHRSERARLLAGARFAEHGLEAVSHARCVAAYVSQGNEPRSYELLEALHQRGVRVLLPVLGPGLARTWGVYTSAADLQVRAPGRPPEPGGEVLPAETISEADAVVAPALAIDAAGTRLGQGGGWYDRVLKHARPGTPVFGMVYGEELIRDVFLPVAEHDVPVDAVITPDHWFLLEGSVFQAQSLGEQAEALTPFADERTEP
ncbi:5-formyltetrahydrofolate cyclo-ligase [Georgenia yuyongxinii]|uniref:5-formyltetrahydrofolate cyclo-ligase n=1 Tax=Georgenia yuyongxinii TaxID=2589797 RepID=A0A5B8BZL8_9MICO|nr:5-formyltetrahydrofolate cyclo-ligase [Georgenia yuyongxinii]QDC23764.1 5-formyltetrahydrofolate cyclo-ligase [Georgenia yuyongxinii]